MKTILATLALLVMPASAFAAPPCSMVARPRA